MHPQRSRFVAAAALAALGVWHLALRRHGLHLPRISDEGEYAYEAQVLDRGGLPYRDAFNQKPPLVFFLYRAAGRTPEAPRRLAVGFSLAAMALLFLSVPAAWGVGPRLAAAGVFGSLSTYPLGDLGFAANTEIFMTGFLALAAWALLKSQGGARAGPWLLLAGAAAGAALSTKQTALWPLAAFGVMAVAARPASGQGPRPWASGLWYAAGCALVPAVLAAYFAARGGLGDLIEQVWRRNLDYASLVLASGAARGQLAWFMRSVAAPFLMGAWPAAGLALYGLSSARARAALTIELVATVWLGASLVGAATGLFLFPHYLVPVVAPLALACALGCRRLAQDYPRVKAAWLAAALALYPGIVRARLYFLEPPDAVARELLFPNPLYEAEAIADYIREHSGADDTVYVFGSEPQIYVAADRRCATRHVFVYPLTLFPDRAQTVFKELKDLAEAKPKFVVFATSPASTLVASKLGEAFRAGVIAWLTRGYEWSGTVWIRGDASRAAFWSAGEKGGALPEWGAPDRLYLFERRP